MPNIVEYEAKGEITPSDKGIQGAVEAARLYSRVGHEVESSLHAIGDQVEQHMAIMETSELYKTGTELKQNLQTRYEKESALPENRGNPHFGSQFMAEVTPQLDEWGKGAQTDHGKQLAVTLKAGIRNEIFNHVSAGQSEMDSAHVIDNGTQTMNTLGSGLITDPSEINLSRTLGTARDTIQGMTMAIPDVSTRESVAREMTSRYLPQLVVARYQGVAESIKNQIATTGGETSPALEQLNKDIKSQLGFQYIAPEMQVKLSGLGAEAVRQGQELFRSKDSTQKAQTIEAGKARYAEIHSVATTLALAGQGPTPDLITAAQDYSRRFGATNPGEVASLDDFILRGQDRAQDNKVQSFNPQIRDKIQTGFSFPVGDPRRPTPASLLQAYSHGQITKEDLTTNTEILSKLDKPETDPTFKPAFEDFKRWQTQMLPGIGGNEKTGTAAARAQFLHDSTSNFMSRGHNGAGWDKALNDITNVNSPHNFAQAVPTYNKMATHGPNAAAWFQHNGLQFDPDGHVTQLYPTGTSGGRPAAPSPAAPAGHPAAGAAPAPAADLQKADEIIWGKK